MEIRTELKNGTKIGSGPQGRESCLRKGFLQDVTMAFESLKNGIDSFQGKNSRQEGCILAKSLSCDTTVMKLQVLY